MKTYALRSLKYSELEVYYTYTKEGLLLSVEVKGEIPVETRKKTFTTAFILENELLAYASINKQKVTVREVPSDLSFTRFWNAYNYKVGNKDRAEKLWYKLSDAEKLFCLEQIKAYDGWLLNKKNMEKTYAETFLNQKRFTNNFSL